MEIKDKYEINQLSKKDGSYDIEKARDLSEKSGGEVAKLISGIVNGGCAKEFFEGFFNELQYEHRTLQQAIHGGLFFQWIKLQAEKPDGHYDGRNEYTVKQCRVMWNALKENNLDFKPPFI